MTESANEAITCLIFYYLYRFYCYLFFSSSSWSLAYSSCILISWIINKKVPQVVLFQLILWVFFHFTRFLSWLVGIYQVIFSFCLSFIVLQERFLPWSFQPKDGQVHLLSSFILSFSWIHPLLVCLSFSSQVRFFVDIIIFFIFLFHRIILLVIIGVCSTLKFLFLIVTFFFFFLTFVYPILSLSFSWIIILSFFTIISIF